ncbi:hypothetical protein COO60DRAFT_191676 [Scenedesmus sp. NREL 46B-D3]|nr:hypothetical protein COO60DRAFT_191676 [Scenedesmus sp. NREL 46B-D3]
MGLLGSCFGACFGGLGSGIPGALQEGSLWGQQRGAAVPGGWQTVPDDVLQAVLEYLAPGEVAVARLTCRHWRLTLSCCSTHLTLPTRFLGAKGARGVLKRAGQVFPGARQVTLTHANGWCDPVQVRAAHSGAPAQAGPARMVLLCGSAGLLWVDGGVREVAWLRGAELAAAGRWRLPP